MKKMFLVAVLALAVSSVGCGRHWRSAMHVAAVTAAIVGTAYILHHHDAHYHHHHCGCHHRHHHGRDVYYYEGRWEYYDYDRGHWYYYRD